ncbi:fluoride efflux transporter FluC [Streptomyces sp. NPDC002644]
MSDTPAPHGPAPHGPAPDPPVITVIAVIALGGAIGASARYAATLRWPAAADAFPWAVFWVNVVGCALMGAVTVLATEGPRTPHPLLRPFLGTGVLGGFTTFSAYALDAHRLDEAGERPLALLYLGGTLAAAMAAVLLGAVAGRRALSRRPPFARRRT